MTKLDYFNFGRSVGRSIGYTHILPQQQYPIHMIHKMMIIEAKNLGESLILSIGKSLVCFFFNLPPRSSSFDTFTGILHFKKKKEKKSFWGRPIINRSIHQWWWWKFNLKKKIFSSKKNSHYHRCLTGLRFYQKKKREQESWQKQKIFTGVNIDDEQQQQ